jgi:glutamate-1-semialdehyde aminotransferase
MKAKPLDQTKTKGLKARAEKRVPVMSQTFSKAPMCFPQGSYPAFLASGKGARVRDVDGNEYIDYVLSLGAVSLGYANPAVDAAVRAQLERGMTFSMASPVEVELAELLAETIPCCEMARFSKTGSEVASAAVRAARAFTGREKIAYGSYHGWHEWYSVTTPRDEGIPRVMKDLVVPFTFNDMASLEGVFAKHKGEIAAVILEPMPMDEPLPGYLDELIAASHKAGALVIFDEIVSGFRYATAGAQERFKVKPDLSTFGKAMANGMPLGAVVGRADVMKMYERVFFSTTFGGETLSLAAAKACIEEYRKHDVTAHLWRIGEKVKAGFDRAAKEAGVDANATGPGPHFVLNVRDGRGEATREVKSLFMQECVRRGVLLHFANANVSFAHGEAEVAETVRVFGEAMAVVGDAVRANKVREWLDGEPYAEAFKRNI